MDEPTLAMGNQKPLTGYTKEEVTQISKAEEAFMGMMKGQGFDNFEETLDPLYDYMGMDIARQRKRLGGNMAIAQAVFSRKQRDKLRSLIGPDLVFIVLNMTKECQSKRVRGRHGDSFGTDFIDILIKYAELCEPAGDDEENAFNISITEDMTRDDVLAQIMDIAEKFSLRKMSPLQSGFWYNEKLSPYVTIVSGEDIQTKSIICLDFPDVNPLHKGKWIYGDFGPAHELVVKATGIDRYNIQMDSFVGKLLGVLNSEGNLIQCLGMSHALESIKLLNEAEIEHLKDDRDPCDEPKCKYVPQPDKPGKIVWLSGKYLVK